MAELQDDILTRKKNSISISLYLVLSCHIRNPEVHYSTHRFVSIYPSFYLEDVQHSAQKVFKQSGNLCLSGYEISDPWRQRTSISLL